MTSFRETNIKTNASGDVRVGEFANTTNSDGWSNVKPRQSSAIAKTSAQAAAVMPAKAKFATSCAGRVPTLSKKLSDTVVIYEFNGKETRIDGRQLADARRLIQLTAEAFKDIKLSNGEIVSFDLSTGVSDLARQISRKFNEVNKNKDPSKELIEMGNAIIKWIRGVQDAPVSLHKELDIRVTNRLIYEELFKICLRINNLKQARELYAKISKAPYDPQRETFTPLLDLFCRNSLLKEAEEVFKCMTEPHSRVKDEQNWKLFTSAETEHYNMMFELCAKLGEKDEACEIYDTMCEKDIRADAYTYHALIKLSVKVENETLLQEMLDEMQNCSIEPLEETNELIEKFQKDSGSANKKTAASETQSFSSKVTKRSIKSFLYDVDNAQNTHNQINQRFEETVSSKATGFKHSIESDLFDLADAKNIHDQINQRFAETVGLDLDERKKNGIAIVKEIERLKAIPTLKRLLSSLDVYNELIAICTFLPDTEKAEELFEDMKSKGLKLHPEVHNLFLKMYNKKSHVKKAEAVFRDLDEPGINEYNFMLDLYTKNENLIKVKELYNGMNESGVQNKFTYKHLFKICEVKKDLSLALSWYEAMDVSCVSPENYHALIKVYLACGQRDDAIDFYKEIIKQVTPLPETQALIDPDKKIPLPSISITSSNSTPLRESIKKERDEKSLEESTETAQPTNWRSSVPKTSDQFPPLQADIKISRALLPANLGSASYAKMAQATTTVSSAKSKQVTSSSSKNKPLTSKFAPLFASCRDSDKFNSRREFSPNLNRFISYLRKEFETGQGKPNLSQRDLADIANHFIELDKHMSMDHEDKKKYKNILCSRLASICTDLDDVNAEWLEQEILDAIQYPSYRMFGAYLKFYRKQNNFEKAKRVFDRYIPKERETFTYNSMLGLCSNRGMVAEAKNVYSSMIKSENPNAIPNAWTYVHLFKTCEIAIPTNPQQALQQADEWFKELTMCESPFCKDPIVKQAYDRVHVAAKELASVDEPVQENDADAADEAADDPKNWRTTVPKTSDQFTSLQKDIKTSQASLPANLGVSSHHSKTVSSIKTSEFYPLVDDSKNKFSKNLKKFFDFLQAQIKNKSSVSELDPADLEYARECMSDLDDYMQIPNLDLNERKDRVYNFLAKICDALDDVENAEWLEQETLSNMYTPNFDTYHTYLRLHCRHAQIEKAEKTFAYLKEFDLEIDTYNTMLKLYCQGKGMFEKAKGIFELLNSKKAIPNSYTYYYLFRVCEKDNKGPQADEWFNELIKANDPLHLDPYVNYALIRLYANADNCDEVISGHYAFMQKNNVSPLAETFNFLIDVYKSDAKKVKFYFQEMEESGVEGDEDTFNALLDICESDEALSVSSFPLIIYEKLKNEKGTMDSASNNTLFNCLISQNHALRRHDGLFSEMFENTIKAQAQTVDSIDCSDLSHGAACFLLNSKLKTLQGKFKVTVIFGENRHADIAKVSAFVQKHFAWETAVSKELSSLVLVKKAAV